MDSEKELFIQQRKQEEEERRAVLVHANPHVQNPPLMVAPDYEKEWSEYLKTIEKGIDSFISEIERVGCETEKFLAYREMHLHADSVSNELLNLMYSCAKRTVKSYPEKSKAIFHILTYLVPGSYDVWVGYGLALQEIELFTDALEKYEKANSLNPNHPLHAIFSGECLFEINDRKGANYQLSIARELLERDEKYQHFRGELDRVLSRF